MARVCDVSIEIPSSETARIQEASILIGHILCYEIENSIFGKKG
jgi:D-sedoheptulose 7-phosphate isomerase